VEVPVPMSERSSPLGRIVAGVGTAVAVGTGVGVGGTRVGAATIAIVGTIVGDDVGATTVAGGVGAEHPAKGSNKRK
jgi:hypothetical protein